MQPPPSEQKPAPTTFDTELQRHNEVLRQAGDVQPQDHVLDIGCGTGQTTRQAARTAHAGSALGVDISGPAIERARDLAKAEGLSNVTFEQANAQSHRFPQQHFDLVISRFGTMFFADPVAAFTNIRQALRPTGRIVMLVWQSQDKNEWAEAIRQALGGPERPVAATTGPDAFSLGDPPKVEQILDAAGFTDLTFTDVQEPVYYGPDVPAALTWVRNFTTTTETLNQLDPTAKTQALTRLQETLSKHQTKDGVWFDSSTWLITARPN